MEVQQLISAVYSQWGYDFREYALTSLTRRVLRIMELEKLSSISDLQELLLRDSFAISTFVKEIPVGVTSIFRDPEFYKAFRAVALPYLQEGKSLKIWHAGCSTGQEVYSMAILLYEEGLLDRSRIYATDLSETALEFARRGRYSIAKLDDMKNDYAAAGCKENFTDYCDLVPEGRGYMTFHRELSEGIVWAEHNLVTDASFNEFDLILCRNVLFYFNAQLQQRVYGLIRESLKEDGILVLGANESLHHSQLEGYYGLDRHQKIYKKRASPFRI